jgi:hypothetical protein
MIALTPEGAATTLAAVVVILVSMAVRTRQRRHARAIAKYRRGEQDRADGQRKQHLDDAHPPACPHRPCAMCEYHHGLPSR